MKVLFTRQARQDLIEIARYLENHNPTRARSYIEELRAARLELADMPEAFGTLEQSRHTGMRKRVFAPYVILYRVEASQVRLVRIIHGARDYLHILEQH